VGKTTHQLVIPDTGEVVGSLYEGDRIYRGKSDDYLKSTIELNKGEPYAKLYMRPMFALARALSGSELQMVYYLLSYLSYDSGIVMNANGKPLSRQIIAQDINLAVKTVDKILQSLHSKQVIGKHNNGREVHFTMNPWLFMRGKRINKTLYEFFKNSRWAKVYDIKRGESNGDHKKE